MSLNHCPQSPGPGGLSFIEGLGGGGKSHSSRLSGGGGASDGLGNLGEGPWEKGSLLTIYPQ